MTGAPARRGFTLVEVALAALIMALLACGVYSASHSLTRVFKRDNVTLDRVAALTLGAERIAQDVREARQIVYPLPDGPVTPFLILRAFDGQLVCYHYRPALKQLQRTALTLAGPPVPDPAPAARDLDGVQFGHKATGLVSFGLFAGEATILASAGRKNQ